MWSFIFVFVKKDGNIQDDEYYREDIFADSYGEAMDKFFSKFKGDMPEIIEIREEHKNEI